VVFGVLTLLLLIDNLRNIATGHVGAGTLLLALILGGGAAYGAIATAPPVAERTSPYDPDQPINTCRPPYKAPT
jgi:hypothetical protein